MRPKKRLGQNFLKDEKVLARFIKACGLKSGDVALEVGAGTGIITSVVAPKVKKLFSYEIDRELADSYLKPLTDKYPNLIIRNSDILDEEFSTFPPKADQPRAGNSQFSIFLGAIPYQITSPLLHKILSSYLPPTTYHPPSVPVLVFIVQKEVAEKVVARPPKATYLSNLVQLYGKAEIVGSPISPTAFWPEPKVYSSILRITPYDIPQLSVLSFQFSTFLHRGFKNPRKMLNKAFPVEVLEKANIDSSLRPQNLSLEDWARLFGILTKRLSQA